MVVHERTLLNPYYNALFSEEYISILYKQTVKERKEQAQCYLCTRYLKSNITDVQYGYRLHSGAGEPLYSSESEVLYTYG